MSNSSSSNPANSKAHLCANEVTVVKQKNMALCLCVEGGSSPCRKDIDVSVANYDSSQACPNVIFDEESSARIGSQELLDIIQNVVIQFIEHNKNSLEYPAKTFPKNDESQDPLSMFRQTQRILFFCPAGASTTSCAESIKNEKDVGMHLPQVSQVSSSMEDSGEHTDSDRTVSANEEVLPDIVIREGTSQKFANNPRARRQSIHTIIGVQNNGSENDKERDSKGTRSAHGVSNEKRPQQHPNVGKRSEQRRLQRKQQRNPKSKQNEIKSKTETQSWSQVANEASTSATVSENSNETENQKQEPDRYIYHRPERLNLGNVAEQRGGPNKDSGKDDSPAKNPILLNGKTTTESSLIRSRPSKDEQSFATEVEECYRVPLGTRTGGGTPRRPDPRIQTYAATPREQELLLEQALQRRKQQENVASENKNIISSWFPLFSWSREESQQSSRQQENHRGEVPQKRQEMQDNIATTFEKPATLHINQASVSGMDIYMQSESSSKTKQRNTSMHEQPRSSNQQGDAHNVGDHSPKSSNRAPDSLSVDHERTEDNLSNSTTDRPQRQGQRQLDKRTEPEGSRKASTKNQAASLSHGSPRKPDHRIQTMSLNKRDQEAILEEALKRKKQQELSSTSSWWFW